MIATFGFNDFIASLDQFYLWFTVKPFVLGILKPANCIHSQSFLLLLIYGFQVFASEKNHKELEKSSIQMEKGWSNLPEKQTQELLPRRRKDREEAEYKSGFLVFLFFLSALCVFAVRMLWFKKHIQQQEN